MGLICYSGYETCPFWNTCSQVKLFTKILCDLVLSFQGVYIFFKRFTPPPISKIISLPQKLYIIYASTEQKKSVKDFIRYIGKIQCNFGGKV